MSRQPDRRDHRGRRPGWLRIASAMAVVVALGFLAFCAAWRVDGGTWERVETPSMGTVAPVGTLLWVKPADFDSLRPGDFISFRPPGSTGPTYSHRVLAIEPNGRLTTKGVLSSPDPWHLTARDVVGSVRMRWWGIGWLAAAAPVLLAGCFVALLVIRLGRPDWGVPTLIVAAAVTASLVIAWYRPLVNAEQLAFTPSPRGGADATHVGTGLLPIRLSAPGGTSVVMHAGQVGSVHVGTADTNHRLRVTLAPDVPPWWWAALVAACLAPATVSTLISLRRRVTPSAVVALGARRRAVV